MLGLVLCGGQSTRMKSDKGLLKYGVDNWADMAVKKIESVSLTTFLSVNTSQFMHYSNLFAPGLLIVDDMSLPIRGPLLGLLSAHLQHPSEDLLILACDMPMMETSLLKELYSFYHENPSAEAFVYKNQHEPEPLCGIYKAKALHYIHGLLIAGKLTRHSMKNMLELIQTVFLPVAEDKKNCFRNINTHAELNGL